MRTLQDILGVPVSFHWLGWHGKDGPSLTGYDSRNPDVIGDQLTSMLNYGGKDTGVIALTYGPTVSAFIHIAVMEMSRQCETRNVPFALCFDPWTVKNASDKNAAMIAALQHPDTQTMFGRRSYMTGLPVLDFATGCDRATILKAVPNIQYLLDGPDFAWPKIGAAQNNNVNQLPCVCLQFNDGTGADRNKQRNNQSLPFRYLPSFAGQTFDSFATSIPVTSKRVQVITWNDVGEGTDVESFASTLL